jgi:putative ATP-dependent endonuclease of OLD family
MYISEITEIKNYRNMTGKKMYFNNEMNFLIGENNIGKTNILELINIVFNINRFQEKDFYDIQSPIELKFKICYDDQEIGFFGDNFDIKDANSVSIRVFQERVDTKLEYFYDVPLDLEIPIRVIKKMNTLYYYSQRTPSKEIDFRKSQGSGRILNYIVKHSLDTKGIEEKDLVYVDEINGITQEINATIGYLNSVTGDTIQAFINNTPEKIISGLLAVGDSSEREITSLGQGIQYSFNIILQILDSIYGVQSTRNEEDFKERLIVGEENKKLFPIIIVLDEPEIHQHPYRQRALMKNIHKIIKNESPQFIRLIKTLFDIDGLVGQIFIATHSPNILSNEYKQYIRIYETMKGDSKELEVISGSKIELDIKQYKHLLRSHMNLKEALFSKKIVFVEGDTENGAFPVFAEKMNLDLDEKGIGVVKLDGADSVVRCIELYKSFGIDVISIIDKDKKDNYAEVEYVYFTTNNDFEEDIYDVYQLIDYLKYNREMGYLQRYIGILKRYIKLEPADFSNQIETIEIDEPTQSQIMSDIREDELKRLASEKNTPRGISLATYATEVPESFKSIIELLKDDIS